MEAESIVEKRERWCLRTDREFHFIDLHLNENKQKTVATEKFGNDDICDRFIFETPLNILCLVTPFHRFTSCYQIQHFPSSLET